MMENNQQHVEIKKSNQGYVLLILISKYIWGWWDGRNIAFLVGPTIDLQKTQTDWNFHNDNVKLELQENIKLYKEIILKLQEKGLQQPHCRTNGGNKELENQAHRWIEEEQEYEKFL